MSTGSGVTCPQPRNAVKRARREGLILRRERDLRSAHSSFWRLHCATRESSECPCSRGLLRRDLAPDGRARLRVRAVGIPRFAARGLGGVPGAWTDRRVQAFGVGTRLDTPGRRERGALGRRSHRVGEGADSHGPRQDGARERAACGTSSSAGAARRRRWPIPTSGRVRPPDRAGPRAPSATSFSAHLPS